ncbi:MAG TPA: glycosyl hydrolase [Symbiobacteriaceae bacterium]|nr:glycosyl hydrolase [Symbiobacteriaceae bacterium]
MLDKTLSGEPLGRDQFRRPSRALGILPFWFWNGEMNEQEMAWQLEQYRAQEMPGLFIHSRFGRKPDYLGDEWFEKVKFTVNKAAELGLQAWIYDEENWPSGTAGWQLPTQYPDLQQRYMEMIVQDVNGPHFVYLQGTDGRYQDLEDCDPICAYAIRANEFDGTITGLIDLNPDLSWEKIVTWASPPGKWKLLFFVERRAKWHTDVLNPAATAKFIEMTHEKYKAAVGDQFGKTVPGFYTDEPAIHYFEVRCNNYVVPWSKQMFKIFREHNGYDLRPYLPALFLNMGERTAKIRYDFWNAISAQYARSFYKPIHDWCRENGLIFTGHMLYEDFLRLHARCEGNLFRIWEHFDLIGVDKLYPKIGTETTGQEHAAIKLCSSAAHAMGSTRVLCESFAGTYWDVTMERMKWLADWEYVLGVNLLNPHGFHYSIEGDRKRDWPPSQFYHHTWWDKYHLFQDYITRNSYLLSGGVHVAKVAVLYPMTAMWANYQPQVPNTETTIIEQEHNWIADRLLRLHFDYDYVDEDVVLAGARVENGRLHVRDEAFPVFLLPPVTHLKPQTLALLEQLVAGGGCVIADSLLPSAPLGGEAPDFGPRVEKLFGIDPSAVGLAGAGAEIRTYVREHAGGGRAVFLQGSGLAEAPNGSAALDAALRSAVAPDVEIDDPAVFCLHRRKDGQEIYFIVNPTEEGRSVHVSVEAVGALERWDSATGAQSPIAVYDVRAGRTHFDLDLPPYGSTFVLLNPAAQVPVLRVTAAPGLAAERVENGVLTGYGRLAADTHVTLSDGRTLPVKAQAPREPAVVKGPWQFAIAGDNVLMVEKFQVAMEEQSGEQIAWAQPAFDDSGWMTFRRGGWELQLPCERDERTYPVTLWYRCRFTTPYVPEDLRLLVDGLKGEWRLYLNGEPLTGPFTRSKLDAQIQEVPIAPRTRAGENLLAIRLTVSDRTSGVLDLIKISGAFSLREESGRLVTAPPVTRVNGPWTAAGYPFYSGTGSYTAQVEVPAAWGGKRLFLEIEAGDDVVEAEVNGQAAGFCLWHPYRLEVTDLVKPGANEVTVKVSNTLINLLEAVPKASGLLGAVRLLPHDVYEVKL